MTVAVLYDGHCGPCRWLMGKALALDRGHRIRPVPLQDPEAEDLLEGMSEEQRMASWHLVDEDAGVHSAGEAVPGLLGKLPGGRTLGWLAARAQPLTSAAYRLTAANRSMLNPLITKRGAARANRRLRERQAAFDRHP